MKIKKIVNKILKPYQKILNEIFGDYTTVKVTMGKSFCCYCRDLEDLEIEIPLIEDPLGTVAFYKKMCNKLEEFGIKENYNSEILSFLHEIGHIKTYNKLNDFTYCKIAPMITKIQHTFFKNSLTMTNLCFKWYFNLALERKADEWAMIYIKNHQAQVKEWEKMLMNNYKKVFKNIDLNA